MLTGLLSSHVPWARNTWNVWVDHVLKDKGKRGLTKAALVNNSGTVAATSSSKFTVSSSDIAQVQRVMMDPENPPDSVKLCGKTFCIKHVSNTHLVAFNGRRYCIISRSKQMFVVGMCESRSKSEAATAWISRIADKLKQANY